MKPLCLVPAGMTAKITWLSLLVTIGSAGSDGNSTRLSLDNYVPKGASPLIATDFVSLSFEFALWPDFAGMAHGTDQKSAGVVDLSISRQ